MSAEVRNGIYLVASIWQPLLLATITLASIYLYTVAHKLHLLLATTSHTHTLHSHRTRTHHRSFSNSIKNKPFILLHFNKYSTKSSLPLKATSLLSQVRWKRRENCFCCWFSDLHFSLSFLVYWCCDAVPVSSWLVASAYSCDVNANWTHLPTCPLW